jgi:hypothetical protein
LSADRHGTPSAAYSFPTSDARITVDTNASLAVGNLRDGYTVAAWIYPVSLTTGYQTILSLSNALILRTSSNKLNWCQRVANGNTTCGGNCEVTANQWTHVATTWDASSETARFYVDGTNCGFTTGVVGLSSTGTGQVAVGGDAFDPARWHFEGSLDSVRLYSRALSAAELGTLASH